MKDKLVKNNITKFDRKARKFGILGSFIIASTLAFGIPMIVSLDNQNDLLTKEVNNDNDLIANLQLQIDNRDFNA